MISKVAVFVCIFGLALAGNLHGRGHYGSVGYSSFAPSYGYTAPVVRSYAPAVSYAAPIRSYAPAVSYAAPIRAYAPAVSYAAPASYYSAPVVSSYVAPSYSYAAPVGRSYVRSYSTPVSLGYGSGYGYSKYQW